VWETIRLAVSCTKAAFNALAEDAEKYLAMKQKFRKDQNVMARPRGKSLDPDA